MTYLHAKGLHPAGHFFADPPQSDYPQGFAKELRTHELKRYKIHR